MIGQGSSAGIELQNLLVNIHNSYIDYYDTSQSLAAFSTTSGGNPSYYQITNEKIDNTRKLAKSFADLWDKQPKGFKEAYSGKFSLTAEPNSELLVWVGIREGNIKSIYGIPLSTIAGGGPIKLWPAP